MTFWFRPQTGSVLGLFRIAIGLLTLYSFALFAKDAAVFFSDEGVLTTATLRRAMNRDYHTILQWIPTAAGVRLALGALFLAALSFTVGFHTRISSVLLYVLVVSFHERNNLVLNGGDSLLRTMLFFFMFAPSGAAFSVDRLRRRLREPEGRPDPPDLILPWSQRMMQIQVTILYLVTAYAKSRGTLYHNGTAMYYVFGLVDFNVRGVEQLMNYPVLTSAMTYLLLFIETALPFLLWFRASRPYAVALGVLTHGWIILFMTIPVFGVLMLASYLPFFSEEELEAALARLRERSKGRRARLYVGGARSRALAAGRLLRAWDIAGLLDIRDLRTLSEEPLPTGVGEPGLQEEPVLIGATGRLLRGFDAWRAVAARLAPTFWLVPLLYVPGVSFLGRRLFRRVPGGPGDASPDPTSRKPLDAGPGRGLVRAPAEPRSAEGAPPEGPSRPGRPDHQP
jgi:hypothetical protein